MADIISQNKIIIIPRKKSFVYYLDTNNSEIYIPRKQFEACRSLGIECEGKPKIIHGRNCYSIAEEQLKELVEKSEFIGIEQKVQLEKKQKEAPKKVEKTIIVYQDANTKTLYIPTKYLGEKKTSSRIIMDKPCVVTNEQQLEKMYNTRIILVKVYTKPNKALEIIVAYIGNRLFISEEIALAFLIDTSLRKRIRVDGEMFAEIAPQELDYIQEDLKQEGITIEFNHKEIMPVKKPQPVVERTYQR